MCATAPYTSIVDCIRQTIRLNGIRGPFQGLGATIIRDTPANAVYLGSFEVSSSPLSHSTALPFHLISSLSSAPLCTAREVSC